MEKGDPGTGASEPSPLILKALRSGASPSPTKRNCAGTAVAIGEGVGVGFGVVPGVGVGEIVGVGVGDGFTITIRRGEIVHPAITSSTVHGTRTAHINVWRKRGFTVRWMPGAERLLPHD